MALARRKFWIAAVALTALTVGASSAGLGAPVAATVNYNQ